MKDRLKKSEFWSAMAILILHLAVFPMALSVLTAAKPDLFSAAQINLLYYAATTVLVFLFMGRYLRRSFDGLVDGPVRCITSFFIGWLLYFLLTMAATYLMQMLHIESDNLNNEVVGTMLGSDRGMIIAMTVFLAPIAEESIFRGGLFCGLYGKSRVAAYAVSMLMFCIYHVWQYAVVLWDASYLLMAIQYIPAAFVLCWIYERSGSLWTSIFFHMSVNAIAVLAVS